MKITYLFAGVLILGFAGAAVADDQFFVFIQLKDKNCRVITDKATRVDAQKSMHRTCPVTGFTSALRQIRAAAWLTPPPALPMRARLQLAPPIPGRFPGMASLIIFRMFLS
jgi:hypothetical protein